MVTKEVGVTKVAYHTPVFERLRECKDTTVVLVGGAGSSKSHSIAQFLIEKLVMEKGKSIGICRKTFPALRMTAMDLVFGLLKEYGIYREENHNKTANTYTHGTNKIWFFSLDELEKIKSANFHYIWMEECNEFSRADYMVMKLRLRGPTTPDCPNQIFLSLNPVDASNWVAKLCGAK